MGEEIARAFDKWDILFEANKRLDNFSNIPNINCLNETYTTICSDKNYINQPMTAGLCDIGPMRDERA